MALQYVDPVELLLELFSQLQSGEVTQAQLTAVLGNYLPLASEGTTIGQSSYDPVAGLVTSVINTPWSIDPSGDVMYSTDGTVPAGYSAAVLGINSSGNYIVTQIAS